MPLSCIHCEGGRLLKRTPDSRKRSRIRIEHHEHAITEQDGFVEGAVPRVAPDVLAELVLVIGVPAVFSRYLPLPSSTKLHWINFQPN